jgi:hypothetical protein
MYWLAMPSHYSDVGFHIENEAQYRKVAEYAANSGKIFPVTGGAYIRWEAGAGVELWVQVEGEDQVVGVNPHFQGDARMRVGLVERVDRSADSRFDGGFHAYAGPRTDQVGGDTPFVFDTPDARRYDDLPLPVIVEASLCGFAHQFVGYKSEGAWRAAQPEFRLSVGSFQQLAPAPDAPKDAPPDAFVRLTGLVIATEERENPFSNVKFRWAHLAVPGGQIDVVADPDIVMGDAIGPGAVVDGLFWLSGRVLRTEGDR